MTQRVSCKPGGFLYRANMETETAVAYTVFKEAGFQVEFATETGNAPKCDERMISGISGKLLVIIGFSGEPIDTESSHFIRVQNKMPSRNTSK